MRRKWEARQSVLSQIVPDFVPDLGFAITCNNNSYYYYYHNYYYYYYYYDTTTTTTRVRPIPVSGIGYRPPIPVVL